MKAHIFIFLVFMSASTYSHAQEKYQSFIMEITKVYNKNLYKFQQESEKAVKEYFNSKQEQITNEQLKYNYLFIPSLLLKKSKKLYERIDSTNLGQYFDPQSMFYHQTLVSLDSLYIGEIRGWYPTVGKNEFCPKPEIDDFIYERLYKQLIDINPDMVFMVQNVGEYFFIKEKCLFVLDRENRDGDFLIYPIDEYTKRFKEQIFNVFFRYEPRLKPIICY